MRAAALLPIALLALHPALAQTSEPEPVPSGCLTCHGGIEPIREAGSPMMQQILALGRERGDPAGCVVCHGGDASATTAELAHDGEAFWPDPGSPWVNEHTCGRCHPRHVATQWNSLMMTEAGKIQGVAWAFGLPEDYVHRWGNYDARNPADPEQRLGTEAYRAYMERLRRKEPGVFPDALQTVPEAPADPGVLDEHPELAAFTYIRTECQRCHLAVRGRAERGDWRGMGCSACHLPYGNEGLYEGGDESIPKDRPGHALVHSIQATREASVSAHGATWSGIPVETCTTCHDRGKRIGVSFQGLMESAFTSPWAEDGGPQPKLHTKHYLAMQEDVHYQRGMICQDCHTSLDVHGDGFLACANLAQVEIECADCHGTPEAFPWELPLGFQDEFGPPPMRGDPRGVARELPEPLEQGTVHAPGDGYLLTARGNPLPEVVRAGDRVLVHTAGGAALELSPLKLLLEEDALGVEPYVAMCAVDLHLESMECYACHASWAPQCYGCHVKIDYSQESRSFDWVAAGHEHASAGRAADSGEEGYSTLVPGRIEEQRSYMRWEDPPLAVNGEGRVTPAMPGCQVSVTVVGEGGQALVANRIFRTPPGSEGSGPQGQLSLDMSPVQPHTMGRARTCESCHLSEKALGHGIAGGRLHRPWDQALTVDLMTATGEILPRSARTQIEAIPGLEADWSRFVTEDGRQLQTVGHHFSGSRPLDGRERANMDRQGLCLSCHQEIPTESLAVSLLHHVADAAGALPTDREAHHGLVHKILLMSAWGQVGGMVLLPLVGLAGIAWLIRRRRRGRAV